MYQYLQEKKFNFITPKPCTDEDILLVHTDKLLKKVKEGKFFDADTPPLPNIYHYATLSAGGAIEAALSSINGEDAFSLMRPPGHHATKDKLGGFCYFNNVAIAVMRAKQKVGKVAIIDLDCHHGNGTEDIMSGKDGVIYVSLHQNPLYPGTGLMSNANCYNYPLDAETDWNVYFTVLDKALKVVKKFNPDLLAISMGFDTYTLDPLTDLSLEKITYNQIAEKIVDLKKPLFAVFEGGYNTEDLPECVYQFLSGLSHK